MSRVKNLVFKLLMLEKLLSNLDKYLLKSRFFNSLPLNVISETRLTSLAML